MAMVRVRLVGVTKLLCHNIQLSDPDNPIVREIAAITKKRSKTEDDRKAIARLEWYGGLYLTEGMAGPVMPTANIRKCLIQGGKITKQGKAIERAAQFLDLNVPLEHDGPKDVDALFALPQYHDRRAVGIGPSRTMRTRPCFRMWSLEARVNLLTDVIDLDVFRRVVDITGQTEGLGDYRTGGYGRFAAEVVEE